MYINIFVYTRTHTLLKRVSSARCTARHIATPAFLGVQVHYRGTSLIGRDNSLGPTIGPYA